ncbi:MAG: hypothetical protein K8U57_06945 [Planctomycetes bacterium]|nr:hypothetical protein [Planctomycetota bacterium]
MILSSINRLTCVVALAVMLGGTMVSSSAQDDLPKTKKKAPSKADSDDDVIIPGKKKAPPKADPDEGEVIVPGKKTKAPTGGIRSLESLIKQANLQYETVEGQNGGVTYKIAITVQSQKTTVFANEVVMGKLADGTEVRAVVLGAPVALFPTDYRSTPPLYKAISEFNNAVVFGKGLVSPQGVGFVCPFWLRNADTQTLLDNLFIVHLGRLELKKRVQPIMEEE